MKKIINIIITIVTLGVILIPRFYRLSTTPPGLHIDEVSFAADAKAIAETGRDTHNVFMPRVFQAFGEYKAPGLTYTMAFWSKLLGKMDNFVARLPSAVAGVVIIISLLATIHTIYPTLSPYLLLAIGTILAYSPWHFDMSRIFYEAFSALSWLSISLFLSTRQLLKPKTLKSYEWYLMVATASIAGYYYASIRYVVIGYLMIISFLSGRDLKHGSFLILKALLVAGLVGIFWVGDLFSEVGLNRPYYYQQKAKLGASLTIDEKRQFCYLALDRNETATRVCYYLWNKPVEKITGALKTVSTYLGTDCLFLKGESEYGFDSEYGAFLFPSVFIYVIGLFFLLKEVVHFVSHVLTRKSALSNSAKLAFLYLSLALLSLVPGSIALNINMRMAMVALYIISIVIAIGLVELSRWVNIHFNRVLALGFYTLLGASYIFYILQSSVHYFFVFTKSNDLQWTSDSGKIFGYVKSVSSNYDRIVDTELHGPLAPYFYGDLTTAEVQNGTYSKPDDIGFFYLIQAGKYELRHINIHDLACEALSHNDKRRTLVLSNPYPELISSRRYAAMSSNGALLLHEVYDLSDVIAYNERTNPNFVVNCRP